jgi:hypothetical protein
MRQSLAERSLEGFALAAFLIAPVAVLHGGVHIRDVRTEKAATQELAMATPAVESLRLQRSEVTRILENSTGNQVLRAPEIGGSIEHTPGNRLPRVPFLNPHPSGELRFVRELGATEPSPSDLSRFIASQQGDGASIKAQGLTVSSQGIVAVEHIKAQSKIGQASTLRLSDLDASGKKEGVSYDISVDADRPGGLKLGIGNQGTTELSVRLQGLSFKRGQTLEALLEAHLTDARKSNSPVNLPFKLEFFDVSAQRAIWIFQPKVFITPETATPMLSLEADLAPGITVQSLKQEAVLIIPISSFLDLVKDGFGGQSGHIFIESLAAFSSDYLAVNEAVLTGNPSLARQVFADLDKQIQDKEQQIKGYQDTINNRLSLNSGRNTRLSVLALMVVLLGMAGVKLSLTLDTESSTPGANWMRENGFL